MTGTAEAAARYCRVDPLFIECGERMWLDPAALLGGDLALCPQPVLRAWPPGAAAGIEIDPSEAAALAALSPTEPRALPAALALAERQRIAERLVQCGLLERAPIPPRRRRGLDDWWSPAALYHFSSRWDGVQARDAVPVDAATAEVAFEHSATQFSEHSERRGPAPDHRVRHGDDAAAVALPRVPDDEFDALLQGRETHRLYRTDRPLSLPHVARLLRRSFGALGVAPLGGGLSALRKSAPSGGGMHPIEAYLLAIDVEGLSAGWYHYRCDQHRLAPMRALDSATARERVIAYTAGQRYFASAPMLVAFGLRFPRHHWKYPRHAKALRVMLLEAGHLGQTFYLSATREGLGAFFTCAINEVDLDRDLGFDGLQQGCIALVGAGWPSSEGAGLRLSHYVGRDGPR